MNIYANENLLNRYFQKYSYGGGGGGLKVKKNQYRPLTEHFFGI